MIDKELGELLDALSREKGDPMTPYEELVMLGYYPEQEFRKSNALCNHSFLHRAHPKSKEEEKEEKKWDAMSKELTMEIENILETLRHNPEKYEEMKDELNEMLTMLINRGEKYFA